MNSEQAKKIDLPRFLLKLGFEPVKIAKEGAEFWYNSPFRTEKTPSFHTSFLNGKWVWKDFGDTGGTVLDFVMRYQNTDVKGALAFLDTGVFEQITPFLRLNNEGNNEQNNAGGVTKDAIFSLKEVKNFAFSSPTLVQYILSKRGIDRDIANQFLKNIHFINTQNGKTYSAVGFQNSEGGFEIRNPFFKSTVPETTKSLSFVRTNANNKKIICFEGFMDFLSYGTLFGIENQHDYLILNSVSFVKKAVEMLQKAHYSPIETFFDNDKAGETATEYFKTYLPNVSPQNKLYAEMTDLNDFLIKVKQL